MSSPRIKADQLLCSIRYNKKLLKEATRKAEGEIAIVQKRHAPNIKQWTKNISTQEKALQKLVAKKKAQIMAGADRVDLDHGSIMVKTITRVKQIKGMLGKLKAAGLNKAIKAAREVVDWDHVEKFNDTTLAMLGTERIEKDQIDYELKQPKKEIE